VSRVLIVGAGIGGLALAAALRESGHQVDVAEQTRSIKSTGAGIVLLPNGMAALHALGLAETVRALGREIDILSISRGGTAIAIRLADVWPEAPFPTVAIRRADLQRALAARAFDGSDAMRLHLGQQLASVELNGRVRFADGDEDAYDLVVGADGVHSMVRASCFPDSPALELDVRYLRFIASGLPLPDDGVWRTFTDDGASSGVIPLGSGRFHCFVQQISPEGEPIAITNLNHVMADAYMRRVGQPHEGPTWIMPVHRWRNGACALLGDAAHALSPTFTEGGSLAIEDAVVLARCLEQKAFLAESLARYEALRAPRLAWAARMSASQLLSLRRPRPERPLDPQLSTEYMRQMYRPLLRDLDQA
jgi:2-polyprenyl-6-methoxyphenol hydroxylase-like FAD-dependent oxidoreductase